MQQWSNIVTFFPYEYSSVQSTVQESLLNIPAAYAVL
jgi:hypothetical protein